MTRNIRPLAEAIRKGKREEGRGKRVEGRGERGEASP
jgi:hypothetical protein